jgi:hypothetical protein
MFSKSLSKQTTIWTFYSEVLVPSKIINIPLAFWTHNAFGFLTLGCVFSLVHSLFTFQYCHVSQNCNNMIVFSKLNGDLITPKCIFYSPWCSHISQTFSLQSFLKLPIVMSQSFCMQLFFAKNKSMYFSPCHWNFDIVLHHNLDKSIFIFILKLTIHTLIPSYWIGL